MNLAAALLALIAGEERHPLSLSYLEIQVEAQAVQLDFRPQALTLIEVPGLELDRDGDRELSALELEAGWPAIRDYLEAGLRLELDGAAAPVAFVEYGFAGADPSRPDAAPSERLLLRLRLPRAQPPARLRLRSDLFFEDGNPDHKLHLSVRGLGAWDEHTFLDAEYREAGFPQRPASVLGEYFRLGWNHVLEGYDHLAFLLALLLGVAGWRALLAAVTAFTLAHSITLCLAALQVARLSPAIVEPGIALSVLFVLWLHLRQGPARARPWLPAFAFGLLHGFGFAGVLGEIGLPPRAASSALLGFNLGVEAGQLSFVLPVALAAAWLRRRLPADTGEELRLTCGALLGAFALHWCGATFPALWPALPAALAPLPVVLLLWGVLALWLRRAATPAGRPLWPALGLSLLLYLLFSAGRFLGALA